jgi:hypothetical protein
MRDVVRRRSTSPRRRTPLEGLRRLVIICAVAAACVRVPLVTQPVRKPLALPPEIGGKTVFERAAAMQTAMESLGADVRRTGGRFRMEGDYLSGALSVRDIVFDGDVPARLLVAPDDISTRDRCASGEGEAHAPRDTGPEFGFWLALADLHANVRGEGTLTGATANVVGSTAADGSARNIVRRSTLFSPAPAVSCISQVRVLNEMAAAESPAEAAALRWQKYRSGESEADRNARLGISAARGQLHWAMEESRPGQWRLTIRQTAASRGSAGDEWMELDLACEATVPLFAKELKSTVEVAKDPSGGWTVCVGG